MKKWLTLILGVLFIFGTLNSNIFAEEEAIIIKGKITTMSLDKTSIEVNGQKIITTPEYIEEALFEIGDSVEITVKEIDKGFEIISYQYVNNEEINLHDLNMQ